MCVCACLCVSLRERNRERVRRENERERERRERVICNMRICMCHGIFRPVSPELQSMNTQVYPRNNMHTLSICIHTRRKNFWAKTHSPSEKWSGAAHQREVLNFTCFPSTSLEILTLKLLPLAFYRVAPTAERRYRVDNAREARSHLRSTRQPYVEVWLFDWGHTYSMRTHI